MNLLEICRYPVKSLNAAAMPQALLTEGAGLPYDRRFAVSFDVASLPDDYAHGRVWRHCHTLKSAPQMARIGLQVDETRGVLRLQADGVGEAETSLQESAASVDAQNFIRDAFADESAQLLSLSDDKPLWDSPNCRLTLLNTASVEAVNAVPNTAAITPAHFRANLIFSGEVAWEEMNWQGRALQIGEAVLRVGEPVPRCAAVSVNPEHGMRDGDVVAQMRAAFGHAHCGVFAEVERSGKIAPGDEVTLLN